jgi:hypothetical protein
VTARSDLVATSGRRVSAAASPRAADSWSLQNGVIPRSGAEYGSTRSGSNTTQAERHLGRGESVRRSSGQQVVSQVSSRYGQPSVPFGRAQAVSRVTFNAPWRVTQWYLA